MKYELFLTVITDGDNYESICNALNLHFDRMEIDALFKILKLEGYNIREFINYHFYKTD